MIKKILLVDDDEDELELFMQSLEDIPGAFSCTQANSGQHAMQLLPEIVPDYIFMDFNLPGMNGLELLQALKNDSRSQHIPVYLYSTTISPETNRIARQRGAAGCIEKPGSIGEMTAALRSVLLFPDSHDTDGKQQ
jgi:CheY-like chemotaxis protein